jgi:hypothetical protein
VQSLDFPSVSEGLDKSLAQCLCYCLCMVIIADSRLIMDLIPHLLTRASWLLMPSLSFGFLEGKFSALSRSPTMSIASCLAGSDVMSLSTPLLFIICNSLGNFVD